MTTHLDHLRQHPHINKHWMCWKPNITLMNNNKPPRWSGREACIDPRKRPPSEPPSSPSPSYTRAWAVMWPWVLHWGNFVCKHESLALHESRDQNLDSSGEVSHHCCISSCLSSGEPSCGTWTWLDWGKRTASLQITHVSLVPFL